MNSDAERPNFTDLANPRWFARDAAFAWGFYGHRLHLYRNTVPHAGYALLQQLCEVVGQHAVYTSNVDGAFEKAGFAPDRIVAIHGSIHRLQCTQADHGVWSADGVTIDVDPDTFRARGTLPTCPTCGAVARPNILMFGDGSFVSGPTDDAEHRFFTHLNAFDASAPHVVIECGAGTHIPSIRVMSDDLLARFPHATLVRLNMRKAFADDEAVAHRTIGIPLGAKAALQAMSAMW
jgi:NAD-dependent SIR2 family protein deacetylase